MLVLSPTIINDGRKLIISSQPMSYMSHDFGESRQEIGPIGGIEFGRFFKNQEADSLLITSALRMNANFPYISPNTGLPSRPIMEVIDAGMRDNTGRENVIRFAHVFKDWIEQNTSGLIFIQIRDTPRFKEIAQKTPSSAFSKLARPFYGFYGNWENFQQYNQGTAYSLFENEVNIPVETVTFEYVPDDDGKVSLSWHLTSKEKKQILHGVHQPQNVRALERLRKLLND